AGGQLDGPDRSAEVEDGDQHFADRLHRPKRAGGAARRRRWHPQHPAEGAGQADGEGDRERNAERAECEAQWGSRAAACSRQAPKASRPTPAMPYGTLCTSIRSRIKISTPTSSEAKPTIRVR